MFTGSLAAIYQTDLKRLLAYSSIAQIGYMTLGLSFHSQLGLTGGFVHLFNHALMKGGLFLVVGCVVYRIGSSNIADMRGLARQMPITMAAFVIGGLALIGVPATVGFVSKWYLVLAALERGWGIVAWLILLSSLLAVIYVWRVVEVVFLAEPPEGQTVEEAPLSMLIPTWCLIGASVYFGINTELTAGVAASAARTLLTGTPW
jgi:multicomponent Na+:H+ antiporter subunit D